MSSPQLAGLIELGELTKLNDLGELIELDVLSQPTGAPISLSLVSPTDELMSQLTNQWDQLAHQVSG